MNLPETWIEVPLGAIAQISGGGTPNRTNPNYFGGGIPWATPSDISRLDGYYLEKTKETLSPEGLKCSSANLVPAGAVLLTSRATIGKTAIVKQPTATNQGFVNLVCDELLAFNEYIARLLTSLGPFMESRAGGSTFKEISRTAVAKIRIPLPTLSEQKRIAELLRQSEQIEKQKLEVVSLADRLALALFQEVFGTIGSDTNWKTEPFGKHITYSKYGPRFPDQQYSDSGTHILRTTDMNRDGTIRWYEAPKLNLTDVQIKEHALKAGTLLVSRSGTIGPVALYDGPEKTCVAGAYLIEFGIADSLEAEYVRTLFMTPYIQQVMQNAVRSAAIPNINAPNIKRIAIPIPPKELQTEFLQKVKVIREWQSSLWASIICIDELRNELLSDAFTGGLTARWREEHIETLRQEAASETTKRKTGRPFKTQISIVEHVRPHREQKLHEPKRGWLIEQLSEFQNNVRWSLYEYKGTLIADDPEVLERFCEQWPVASDAHLHDRICRALDQLASLGLIAKVSLRSQDDEGKIRFLTGYRFLRDEEREYQVNEVARLEKVFEEVAE